MSLFEETIDIAIAIDQKLFVNSILLLISVGLILLKNLTYWMIIALRIEND